MSLTFSTHIITKSSIFRLQFLHISLFTKQPRAASFAFDFRKKDLENTTYDITNETKVVVMVNIMMQVANQFKVVGK